MSVMVTVYLRDCIVMAADSRKCSKYLEEPPRYEVLSDSVQKLFCIKDNSVGISVCGDAELDGKSIEDFLQQFEMMCIENTDNVKSIAYKLRDAVKGKYKENIWFDVAGYQSGKRYVYKIHNDEVTSEVDDMEANMVGVHWAGDASILKEILEIKQLFDIDFSNMDNKSGIELADFLADLVCKFHKFQVGIGTCGGPIDILLLTKEKSTWIRHKKLHLDEK